MAVHVGCPSSHMISKPRRRRWGGAMERCFHKLVVGILLAFLFLCDRPWLLKCDGLSLRVLSWNVLAPIHAPPTKYPWSDPCYLEWSYRSQCIAQFLLQERADVVCLQEIQIGPCWDKLYHSNGLDEQYDAVLQNVTRGHPVANAVLIRRDGPVTRIRSVESRSRALIVVLEIGGVSSSSDTTQRDHDDDDAVPNPPPRRFVALANVHLEAGMDAEQDETRFCQLQSLMKRIHRHSQELSKALSSGAAGASTRSGNATTPNDPAVVLMGDWNMLPHGALYQLLSTGRIHDSMRKENRYRRIQLPLPLLPLQDAFARQSGTGRTSRQVRPGRDAACGTTYAGGSVLDYVWVSKGVTVQETWVQRPWEELGDGSGRPDIRAAQRRRNGRRFFLWPNAHHPSDHLAIGATLQL